MLGRGWGRGWRSQADFQSALPSVVSGCLHIVFEPLYGDVAALHRCAVVSLEAFSPLFSKLKWVAVRMCDVAGSAVSTLRQVFITPRDDERFKGLARIESDSIVLSWRVMTEMISASDQAGPVIGERASTRAICPSPVRSKSRCARQAAIPTGSAVRLVRRAARKEEGAADSTRMAGARRRWLPSLGTAAGGSGDSAGRFRRGG